MSRVVKIATISRLTYLVAITREEYIVMCEQEMIKAGENGCDLVLLPENFDTFGTLEMETTDGGIYDEKTDHSQLRRALAEPIPGKMTERFAKICKKYNMYIIANYTELYGEKMFNTAVILDRSGNVVGKYRKTHLCASEKRCCGIDAGDELPVFKLDFGCIGIAICMDIYFPEIFRILTLKGAEIIFWPHQTYGPSEETLEIMVRSKAMDYICFMVTSNFASPNYYAPYSQGHIFTGRAMIVNPEGLVIAETGHYPGIAVSIIDLSIARIGKDVACIRRIGIDYLKEDLLRFRRPELYDEIVKACDNEAVMNGRFID
jgi:predicted amidohydrolase